MTAEQEREWLDRDAAQSRRRYAAKAAAWTDAERDKVNAKARARRLTTA